MQPEFKIQEIFPREIGKSDKQISAQHEFVHKICKSQGKYFLYFKLNVY